MIGGTFTVATSDDPRFVSGVSYPLTIDDSLVELTVVESVTATAIPAPAPAVAPVATAATVVTAGGAPVSAVEPALTTGSTPATA